METTNTNGKLVIGQSTGLSAAEKSPLRNTYLGYERDRERWDFVDLLYTGAYLEKEHVKTVIIQHAPSENAKKYDERIKLLDPDLIYTEAIAELAGMLASAERDAVRQWQGEDEGGGQGGGPNEGLGSPEDPSSVAYRLTERYDGAESSLRLFWRHAVPRLIRRQEHWLVVEGPRRNVDGVLTGHTRVRHLRPQDVDGRRYDGGRLIEAKVRERRVIPKSVRDKPKEEDHYFVFDLEGVQEYRIVKDEKTGKEREETVGAKHTYDYYVAAGDAERGRRGEASVKRLPLVEIRLPLDVHLGYMLARSAMAILNMISRRDADTNHKQFLADPAPDEELGSEDGTSAEEHIAQAEGGSEYWQVMPGGMPKWIARDMDPVRETREVLKEKREAFRRNAFLAYASIAKEVTATEANQARSGMVAFLTMLSASLDSGENEVNFLIEQTELPDSPQAWGQARVQRSEKFDLDHLGLFKTQKEAVYGTDPLPMTEGAEVDFLKTTYEAFGWKEDHDAIQRLVRAKNKLIGIRGDEVGATAEQDVESLIEEIENA